MNLIATCINVSEIRTIKEKSLAVNYPSINNNSELFAKELKRLIDGKCIAKVLSLTFFINIFITFRFSSLFDIFIRERTKELAHSLHQSCPRTPNPDPHQSVQRCFETRQRHPTSLLNAIVE